MKVAIYGASLSGCYADQILKLQGHEVVFFLDRQPENRHQEILDEIPIYKNVELVPDETKSGIQLLVVAVGEENVARNLKKDLENVFSCEVITIYDDPYLSFYKMFKEYHLKIAYLKEEGFYKSFEEGQSVDQWGNAIPWINYSLLELLRTRVNKDMTVFEYGMGHSTIWWSERVKKVVSVDHDKDWYDYVETRVNKENTELVYKNLEYDGDYSRTIKSYDKFDLVFVDGRDRVNCAINSIGNLTENGVIVWDDTERDYYESGFEYLKKQGFKCLQLKGMKALADYASYTSVFYKNNNCLGL
ncbi:hypothetical protein [Saccharibacillus sp. JS10]|uniref:hypothetical protein n=1 Tax=Saccharibacillus sp. JS10 TaxID=2950552 RepID=UPI00210D57E8|nr:hypothetical protein [Saccharibacillus sp. JS10]MCQ4088806.1 hypothetical protein [Saccharibacillus sp. JS10]